MRASVVAVTVGAVALAAGVLTVTPYATAGNEATAVSSYGDRTSTASMTARTQSSPVIQIRGNKIRLELWEWGGCATIEGARLEGDGGSYYFSKADNIYPIHDIEPGRYKLWVVGRVTEGGGVCSGGEIKATVHYR